MLEENYASDFASVKHLLRRAQEEEAKNKEKDKEYMLFTGRHASIVRGNSKYGCWQYLELQSPRSNGYKTLTNERLKNRFKCKAYNKKFGSSDIALSSVLIPLDNFTDSVPFREYMGYINTRKHLQMKGTDGDIK